MRKVLFVCLGNICRSPAADGIFQDLVSSRQLSDEVYVDSAGTGGWHAGERADSRMIAHAKKRGYDLKSIARQFQRSDFDEFDYILAMDGQNLKDIKSLDPENRYGDKVKMFVEFCQKCKVDFVPDPYFGGEEGFENVLDIIEDGAAGLLKQIENDLK